jgi:type I restriction enzyme, S subunit
VIAGLKPYPEYKESRIPWIGQVPGHWEVLPIGRLLVQRKEKNDPIKTKNILSLSLHTGVIPYSEKKTGGNKAKEDLTAYMLAYPGDIVLNSMNVVVGSVGLSKYFGAVSPVYYMLHPRHNDDLVEYFDAVFQDVTFQSSLFGLGNGIMVIQSKSSGKLNTIRMRIPMTKLKLVSLPCPVPEEQAAIVRFLGWANGRLERAIRAKRKTIALLNEQKQAIIHRAVTRGFDPYVNLKPSGIPWLGDIPRHWETPLFGRLLTKIEQGWSPVAAEGELAAAQWAVLTLSAVRRGVFDGTAIKPVSRTADIPTSIEVHDGDLLLTRSNTRDRVGDVCIAREPRHRTLLCDLIYRIRLRKEVVFPEFLVYQLLSPEGRGQIERDARGSSGTMPKISQGHIKSWRVLLPPMEEQWRIVERINTENIPLNAAISRLEREIELLREYRTRLTADVVTGKLDVREAAARLPDEPVPDIEEESSDLNDNADLSDEEIME